MALECPPFSDFVILLVDFNAYRGNDTDVCCVIRFLGK